MRAYTGTFVKQNGETRTMSYARLTDLPQAFLQEHLTGTGKQRDLGNGRELVWDLENNGFRVFNHNAVVGAVSEFNHVDTVIENWRSTQNNS